MKSATIISILLANNMMISSIFGFQPFQNKKLIFGNKLIHPNNHHPSLLILQSITPGEDIYYIENQFKMMSDVKGLLKFKKFLNSDEIQALIEDELFEKEEFADIWTEVVGDLKKPCTLEQFVTINRKIDDEIEEDSADGEEDSLLETDTIESITYENDSNDANDGNDNKAIVFRTNGDDTISIWDATYNPNQHMDPNFIKYLKDYFDTKAIDGLLNYTSFYDWSDVKDLLVSGNIDVEILKDLWLEALAETDNSNNNNNNSNKKSSSSSSSSSSRKSNVGYKEAFISFDTFLRINIRLNEVIEEVDEAIESLSDKDLEIYFRSEFQILLISENSKNKQSKQVSYKNVMKWNDLQETIVESGLVEDEVMTLWKSVKIPTTTIRNSIGSGSSGNSNDNDDDVSGNNIVIDKTSSSSSSSVMNKGFGNKKDKKTLIPTSDNDSSSSSSSSSSLSSNNNMKLDAITEDEFVSFNFMLDEYLAQKAPPSPVNWDPIGQQN